MFFSLLLTLAGCPASAADQIVTGPDRRNEIDLRIQELDAERAEASTKGPKTAVYVGLGEMLLGAVPLAVGLTAHEHWGEGRARYRGGIITGATLAGIGGLTALVGGLILGERIKHRSEIDAERELLIEKRDGLAAALSRLELRSPYRNGTQLVTLFVRF